MAEPAYDTNARLITCILPKGRARALQQVLVDERGIQTGTFHYGRGVGRESHIRDRGIGEQQEREVFDVIVDNDVAEELFAYIFAEAKMDEPHGGMIYMTAIPRTTRMTLPDLPKEAD